MSGDCEDVVQAGDDIVVSADCAQGGGDINVTVVSGGVGPAGPAGQGVPAGGATGQVLAKTANADYATGWVNQTGGGGSSAWGDITGKPTTFPPDRRATVTVGRSGADYIATGTLGSPTDHSTIQTAIAAVQAAGGGTVFIRAGVYFLGATISVTAPNVQIIGEGRATELRAVGNYGNVIHCALTPAPTSWPGLSGLVIESIRFESTVERTSGCAIYAQRTHNAVIRDVYLADLTYGVAYGLTTPVPPAFWIGIHLDGQDQCLIDNVVGCAISKGIKVNGVVSASADFSYDGMISNCKLWGSPGTKRGTAIEVGPYGGGTVLDFNSLNQWEYALKALAVGDLDVPAQGGGIITIRGGYTENDEHGYHCIGWQNVVVSDLWGSLHCVDCEKIFISGTAAPRSEVPQCTVERTDDGVINPDTGMYPPETIECLIYGNVDVITVGSAPSIAGMVIRKFDASSVIFQGDPRLTNARTPTAHTHAASDITSGTLAAARLPGAPVYLQQTTPPGTGWVWFQTNGSGDVVDIITG